MALLCGVCRRSTAVATCRICGRPVCRDDLDTELGVCVLCRESLCSVCRERLAVASCEACGRPVCDHCGVQVTPVAWLCPSCAERYLDEGRASWPPSSLVGEELARLRSSLTSLLSPRRRPENGPERRASPEASHGEVSSGSRRM